MPDNTVVTSAPTTPPTKTPSGADTGALPDEVIQLQKEMNLAMGWLLRTRASMDACHQKQVSNTETAFHENEAEATEIIREAKAHCTIMIWEAEAVNTATSQEAEGACSATIRKVEAMCTAAIREAETTCADHACTLQHTHRDSMQGLQREAIEEEGKDCQSFLATCRVALQVCHPEAHGVLMYLLQLLMGNMSLATLLAIPPSIHCQGGTYPCDFLSNYSGSTWTLRNQMTMPFTWPGCVLAIVRRQSCGNLRRAALPEAERNSWKGVDEKPSLKTQI